MTLSDVAFPVSLEWARAHALVFGKPLADRLAQLHAEHGTANCWPTAAPVGDGRYYLYAEVLTEVMPGGLLHEMWAAADQAVVLAEVEVMPLAEVIAMLPAEPATP